MNSRVLPLVALIVAGGMFFFYVNPVWSGPIAATKAAIAHDDLALAAAKQYAAQQNALASERDAIDPNDLARLTTFLPDSVDNVGLILDLNGLAARSGLLLQNIDVTANNTVVPGAQSTVATNPVGSVDLSISAAGPYSALQTFLAGVERSARLLDLRSVIVKGSDTGVYVYQMTLRLYWLR